MGEKRVGIAISDASARLASPVCILPAAEVMSCAKSFKRVLEDWEPELIVCGLPYTMAGEMGPQAERIKSTCTELAHKLGLPLEFMDERLSSQEAKRILREQGKSEREMRGKLDAIAASVTLQAWLDAQMREAHDE